jgi:hypothetical protein
VKHNAVPDFEGAGYRAICYTIGCGWKGEVHPFRWHEPRSVRAAEDEAWEDCEQHEERSREISG